MSSYGRQRIAVILPAYNEESTLEQTIVSFWQVIPDAEIVVVDNNSSDKTGAIARETIARLNISGRVIHEPRQGKGNAIRRAFCDIDADVYLMCDADMTYPAPMALMLLSPIINDDADMVVGDRLSEGDYGRENKRRFHGLGNGLVRRLINSLFASDLRDVMSGYRAMSRKFVKNYPILVDGFQLETDLTLHALDKRFRVKEISVSYRDRPTGSFSKLNTISDGAKVLITIAHILRYYRPLAFFGALGALLGMLGILTAIPVLEDWIVHRYIYHVPLAILSVGLELSAAMSLGIGLLLDSITHQHRMRAELRLLDYSSSNEIARNREG